MWLAIEQGLVEGAGFLFEKQIMVEVGNLKLITFGSERAKVFPVPSSQVSHSSGDWCVICHEANYTSVSTPWVGYLCPSVSTLS